MTTKTLDWLNQNRFRAYPFINDVNLIDNGVRIPDSVLLDCVVMDTRHDIGIPELIFNKIVVTQDNTVVSFSYDGISTSCTLTGGEISGSGSFVKVTGSMLTGLPTQFLHMNLVFSSHAYILDKAGPGEWNFKGKVFPSKIITVTASGVSGIKTNGSDKVQAAGTATGNVHLVDGYRTQPVIQNGNVMVKVGTRYGLDPCHYPREEIKNTICSDLMFFFCGQNAINSGNVVLKGGPGVNIKQGSKYKAKKDIIDTYGQIGVHQGEEIPCIEISATSELLKIYRPSNGSSSGSSADSSSI